jgi:hypothetical protein
VLIVRLGAFGSRETREIRGCARTWRRHSIGGASEALGMLSTKIDHFGGSCFQLGDVRLLKPTSFLEDNLASGPGPTHVSGAASRTLLNEATCAVRFSILRHLAHYGVNLVYRVALIS